MSKLIILLFNIIKKLAVYYENKIKGRGLRSTY